MEEKIRSTVYISKAVHDHSKKFKIKLSEFLDTEYKRKYLNREILENELKLFQNKIQEIKLKLTNFDDREEYVKKSLTDREHRFLATVKQRLVKGFEMKLILKSFNNEFNRDFSEVEFKQLVSDYQRQYEVQLSYALDKKKDRRRK